MSRIASAWLRRPRCFARFFVVAGLAAAVAGPTRSQTLDGYVEVGGTRTDESTEQPPSAPIPTDLDAPFGRLSFVYTHPLWPNLNFIVGGYFERTDPEGVSAGQPVDGSLQKIRPYATFRLRTRVIRAEIGVERNETRTKSWVPGDPFDLRLIRDSVGGTIGWFPDSRNYVQLQAVRSDERDADRVTADRQISDATLTAQYRPVDWLGIQYRGGISNTEDQVTRTEIDTLNQNLRLLYADSFWNGRIAVNSDYNYNWLNEDTRVFGRGEVERRLFPSGGLSAIDDFPEIDPLPPNPALVDFDRVTGAGIDIGNPPVGGDRRLRNLGVDFGLPARVNRLLVWVDRDVRIEVSRSFTWDIWTSDDNENWTRRATVVAAPFGPFDTRFELRFDAVVARYVKVTVAPLDPTVPFASSYPVILVTELEAYEMVPADDLERSDTRWSQLYSLNVRTRLLADQNFYYDLNYLLNTAQYGARRWSLTNALSYSRALTRVWSLSARVANEQGEEYLADRDANTYSASITAVPSEVLRSSLIASGRRERWGHTEVNTDSLIWSTTATPYRGIDLNVGLGGSRQSNDTGRRTLSRLINATMSVVPHPALAFNFSVQDNTRKLSGAGLGDIEDPNRSYEAAVTFSPLQTLYAYASFRTETRGGKGSRDLRTYNFSWSPFPYGTLRVALIFNEYYDSDFDTLSRLWGPSVRWNVTPRSYLDLSYERTTTDSTETQFERGVYSVTLHLSF